MIFACRPDRCEVERSMILRTVAGTGADDYFLSTFFCTGDRNSLLRTVQAEVRKITVHQVHLARQNGAQGDGMTTADRGISRRRNGTPGKMLR